MQKFFSNGKLLLTGEYLVLDGALSLAVPTQFGQSLTTESIDEPKLIWKSIDYKGAVWFEEEFNIKNELSRFTLNDNEISNKLLQILSATKQFNPNFLNSDNGYKVTTQLDFHKNWGLGSSSTLINNIAQWADIDAYQLLEHTFGGSGYDIACAQHHVPITYQLEFYEEISHSIRNNKKRQIKSVDFNPNFKDHLYFVHLNKKQNSQVAIARYKTHKNDSAFAISEISDITSKVISCTDLENFETLLTSHENIISKIIKQKTIKELLFNDYKGAIKSLGAWGGDFILVTENENSLNYFKNKGYFTIIPYNEMVLK